MVFGQTFVHAVAPFLLASSSPSSFQDMAQRANSIYQDLSQAPIFHQASPTVKFSFVCPTPDDDATPNADDLLMVTSVATTATNDRDVRSNTNASSLFQRVADRYGNDKPLAVYLPGLDGYGISAVAQYEDLSNTFELWRMMVSVADRTPFYELVTTIADFIEDLSRQNDGRPITLIGESFGGVVAPAVALRLNNTATRENRTNPLRGMVLVNPATSFEETQWSALGPFLASLRFLPKVDWLPTPYSVLGGLTLSALVPDMTQLQRLLSLIFGIPVQNLDQLSDAVVGLTKGFEILEERLPPETVQHRIEQWLPVACAVVNERLSSLNVTTLVVAGQDDVFLPSRREADRLEREMPSCKKLVVRGSGHFVLDDRVNLTEAILYSDIDPLNWKTKQTKYDPITDWKLPSQEVIDTVLEKRVEPLRRLASPAFFSTDASGKRYKGLGRVPSKGPIVFVANHQLLGLDLGMVIAELFTQRGIVPRGLGHPVIFQGGDSNQQPPSAVSFTPGIRRDEDRNNAPFDNQLFRQFGAVVVTPRNYYRLLQTGQNVLLFPGGVREVFHGKDEAYQLFWPNRTDFVRTAARFNATVVPISAVGAADSLNVLIDAPDMAKLPFGLGERVMQSSANVTAARFNVEDEHELFTPPLVVPAKPARHYFIFGKPLSTAELDHNDNEGCAEFYQTVQDEMNRGFDDVLKARKNDPYSSPVRRLAYERITGKQAPTFSVSEFSRH